MDADLRELTRAVLAGDTTLTPKFVQALARRDGEPLARLRKLVTRVNAKCRVSDVSVSIARPYGRGEERVTAHTVPWRWVVATVKRAAGRVHYVAWKFGPTGWPCQVRDATALLVVPLRDLELVVIGVGVVNGQDPKVCQAWPMLGAVSNDAFLDLTREWALDFGAADRVVMTLDQAQKLAGKATGHALTGKWGSSLVPRAPRPSRMFSDPSYDGRV